MLKNFWGEHRDESKVSTNRCVPKDDWDKWIQSVVYRVVYRVKFCDIYDLAVYYWNIILLFYCARTIIVNIVPLSSNSYHDVSSTPVIALGQLESHRSPPNDSSFPASLDCKFPTHAGWKHAKLKRFVKNTRNFFFLFPLLLLFPSFRRKRSMDYTRGKIDVSLNIGDRQTGKAWIKRMLAS